MSRLTDEPHSLRSDGLRMLDLHTHMNTKSITNKICWLNVSVSYIRQVDSASTTKPTRFWCCSVTRQTDAREKPFLSFLSTRLYFAPAAVVLCVCGTAGGNDSTSDSGLVVCTGRSCVSVADVDCGLWVEPTLSSVSYHYGSRCPNCRIIKGHPMSSCVIPPRWPNCRIIKDHPWSNCVISPRLS